MGVLGSSWLRPGSSSGTGTWVGGGAVVRPSGQVAPAALGDLKHLRGWAQSDGAPSAGQEVCWWQLRADKKGERV